MSKSFLRLILDHAFFGENYIGVYQHLLKLFRFSSESQSHTTLSMTKTKFLLPKQFETDNINNWKSSCVKMDRISRMSLVTSTFFHEEKVQLKTLNASEYIKKAVCVQLHALMRIQKRRNTVGFKTAMNHFPHVSFSQIINDFPL
ncbi:hypothetical protein TNCT_613891 [Trichonephila clavata]|uniref:Uncharacterized protein n=1 Tax=Trichonephila clavata TaxID=2740835 RepID=A0A8X6GFQ7_TRICU|nr:hypothetical protein TNCT_613891 [Trichonephila clavata]